MIKKRSRVRRTVRLVTVDVLHHWTHVVLGIVWLYVVSFFIPNAMNKYVGLVVLGSLLPDAEHILYIFFMRRNAPYSKAVKQFLRQKSIREMVQFVKSNHKSKIFLPMHHMLMPVVIMIVAFIAYFGQREGTLVFFGAIATHYIYDMFDDLLYLGHLNPNWTRGIPHFRERSRE